MVWVLGDHNTCDIGTGAKTWDWTSGFPVPDYMPMLQYCLHEGLVPNTDPVQGEIDVYHYDRLIYSGPKKFAPKVGSFLSGIDLTVELTVKGDKKEHKYIGPDGVVILRMIE